MPWRTTWYRSTSTWPRRMPIDLVLPGLVALHEPLDRAVLVAGVVVDMHPGVPIEPLDDQVDERLEGRLLAGPVMAPDRAVVVTAVAGPPRDAEQVLQPVVEHPWVGLDVEEEVRRRWLGERGKAVAGCLRVGLDELIEELVAVLDPRPGSGPARVRGPAASRSCPGPCGPRAGPRARGGWARRRRRAAGWRCGSSRPRSKGDRRPGAGPCKSGTRCTPGSGRPDRDTSRVAARRGGRR